MFAQSLLLGTFVWSIIRAGGTGRSQDSFSSSWPQAVTCLYAARLVAEAVEQRRHEIDTAQRQEPFLDEILEYLTGQFKRELQEIGFLYRPRRAEAVFFTPLTEVKLDTVLGCVRNLSRILLPIF